MKWTTKISTHKKGAVYVRGKELTKMIGTASFSEMAFLLMKGKMPTPKEAKFLDAILVSSVEHGVEVPSAYVPRVVMSTGNEMNAALAGGMLAIGNHHGGAIEQAAILLESETSAGDIVKETLARKERIPGLGHKIYKTSDPRSEALFEYARKLKMKGAFIKKAKDVAKEFEKQSGKKLALNIDMAIAASMLELGFDAKLGKALFCLARLPGMIAHAHEEYIEEKPYRRFEEEDVIYTGPNV